MRVKQYAYDDVSDTDPRTMGVDALNALGHEKQPILRAIREKCLECCCDQVAEVTRCQIVDCALWPYRMRTNPFSLNKGNAAALKGAKPCE